MKEKALKIQEKGFTLIELMVVVSIIAIVAIVSFQYLGAGSSGAPMYVWQDCTVDLPPGQALQQVVSIRPLSWTTRARGVEEVPTTTPLVIPGLLYNVTVTFKEN
jgi:prepilin-type N-terminal cleavage/methylation domain-containing protein